MWRLHTAIRDWSITQSQVSRAANLDQLVCDGKALRGSIEPSAGGGSAFMAQVTLYSAALGVGISQACYATSAHTQRPFFSWLWRCISKSPSHAETLNQPWVSPRLMWVSITDMYWCLVIAPEHRPRAALQRHLR